MRGSSLGRAWLTALTLIVWLLALTPAFAQLPGMPESTQPATEPDRSSPQELMRSFMALGGEAAAGNEAKWGQAAKCLNVPAVLREQASERAKLLYGVLSKLEPEPEAMLDAETVEQAGTESVRFFPRPETHAWVAEQLENIDHLDQLSPIVLTRQGDRNWQFSEQTVQRTPALAANLQSLEPQSNGARLAQVIDWLGPTFERTDRWGWLALLIAIGGGLVLGKLVQLACNALARRLERKGWSVRATVFHSAAAPASLALLTIGLSVGLGFIHTGVDMEAWLGRVQRLLYILAAGWFIYNLVDVVEFGMRRGVEQAQQKKKAARKNRRKSRPEPDPAAASEMIIPMIRKTLRVFVAIVVLLVIASNVFAMNVTGLIAGLGVVGLAISLAAQESVKNVFGSLTVFFDKPFILGDYITFGDYTGVVEEIGFRSTRIRLLTGHLVTIPNMKFIDGDIENIGVRPYIRRVMDITITYDTPPAKIDEALTIVRRLLTEDEEVVAQGRFDMTAFPPRIAFDELNSDSLNIKAYYWYQLDKENGSSRGYWTYLDHCQLVNRKLFDRFSEAGIEFAFPTQTLYMAGDPNRRLDVNVLQGEDRPAGSRVN